MLLGFLMKQQATAAVHAKALRLNAAAVAEVSPGTVINLVSNDVRRFDDGGWVWAGGRGRRARPGRVFAGMPGARACKTHYGGWLPFAA